MELSFPHRLGLLDVLLVRAAGEQFAMPLGLVRRTAESPEPDDESQDSPLVRLDRWLGLHALGEPRHVVRLSLRGREICFLVDEICCRTRLVVQPLAGPLAGHRRYSGGAVLEDGSIVLVVDPARARSPVLAGQARPQSM